MGSSCNQLLAKVAPISLTNQPNKLGTQFYLNAGSSFLCPLSLGNAQQLHGIGKLQRNDGMGINKPTGGADQEPFSPAVVSPGIAVKEAPSNGDSMPMLPMTRPPPCGIGARLGSETIPTMAEYPIGSADGQTQSATLKDREIGP
jgi:hypothetical protein